MADSESPAGIVDLVSMSLRRERARTGLSLTELAKRAGVAKSTLSQLENGTGNPSLETLWAIGTALGVPLSRLIDPPRSDIRVIRAGEGAVMHAEHDSYAAAMLAPRPPPRHLPGQRRAGPGPPRPGARAGHHRARDRRRRPGPGRTAGRDRGTGPGRLRPLPG